ncbi:MAG: hypothetical protein ACRDLL_11755 [Solirubrobacterales bacterium]
MARSTVFRKPFRKLFHWPFRKLFRIRERGWCRVRHHTADRGARVLPTSLRSIEVWS